MGVKKVIVDTIKTIGWLFFIFFLVLFHIIFYPFFYMTRKRLDRAEAKKKPLRSLYRRDSAYLCNQIVDGGEGLVYLFGEPVGTSLRAGMKIVGPKGSEYEIQEVEGFDDSEDENEFTLVIPAGTEDSTVIIKSNYLDWKSFKQRIDKEYVIVLKVR